MPKAGKYIVFEGHEGVGKTTQLRLAAKNLQEVGHNVLMIREPGESSIGQDIRNILLSSSGDVTPEAELALFTADRAQTNSEIIQPHIEQGGVVLSDRSYRSTIAYQGAGGKVERHAIELVTKLLVGERYMNPDLVLVLCRRGLDWQKRVVDRGNGLDRIERKESDYHDRVRDQFEKIASESGCVRIEADGTIEEVEKSICIHFGKIGLLGAKNSI